MPSGNLINIQFNEDLDLEAVLVIPAVQTGFGSPTPFNITETWVVLRNGANKVTQGEPTDIPGERSAINFQQAFNLDYNNTGLYSVVRTENIVTITALNTTVTGITFNDAYCYNPFPTVGDVEFTYEAFNTSNLQIESIEYSAPANPANACTKVKVTVTANQELSQVTSPISQSLSSDTFEFEYNRGAFGILTVKNGLGNTVSMSFGTPAILSAANFNVNVYNSPNGATVIITEGFATGDDQITPEFRLKTGPLTFTPWQESNVFGNIAPGTYDLQIRDQYGCIKPTALQRPKTFIVPQFVNGRPAYFYLSKALSFRFANRVDFNDAGNYKNDENTLSCEADTVIAYKEIQQFQSSDVITNQFKSNYATNRAYVIKKDGTETEVAVVKKSSNMDVKDKRDAIKVNLGGGKTGIYFMAGNVYDYDTNGITDDYALNGTLPYWATMGNYFSIDNIWFQIDEVYFDETLNADVIVIDAAYGGAPASVIVGSIFDVFNYEVYEFTIDLVDYLDEQIQVRINAEDPQYNELTYLSEVIDVKIRQEGTVEIKYSNPENTDIFYSTGIQNLLRMPLFKKEAYPVETNENYKTDSNTVLLSSTVFEGTRFILLPVTTEIMRKLIQAFNHKTLQMDGVFYVINGECTVEGPLEQSNIYVVTAPLIKTSGPFNNNLSNSGNELFDTTNIEIPGLIDLGDGEFLKY